jgi:hypothetical protein
VVDAPHQLRSGAGDRTGSDLLERPEEITVAAARVADEVVGARMDLLLERGLRIDQAATAKDPMDLADDLTGVEDVLDDGLDQDGVDALVGEGMWRASAMNCASGLL